MNKRQLFRHRGCSETGLKHMQSLERGAVSEQVGIHHRSDEIISERGHDTGFESYLLTLVCRDGEKQQ